MNYPEWINEIFSSPRDKIIYNTINHTRVIDLIIKRICDIINDCAHHYYDNNKIVYYINDMVYEGYMDYTRMMAIVIALCETKQYKLIDKLLKSRVLEIGHKHHILTYGYINDDLNFILAIINNHTSDFSTQLDMIYNAIHNNANRIVIYLIRKYNIYNDDIIIYCIDNNMERAVIDIIQMGIIVNHDNVFASLCCNDNVKLVKEFMKVFPDIDVTDGYGYALINNFTDIVNYLQIFLK